MAFATPTTATVRHEGSGATWRKGLAKMSRNKSAWALSSAFKVTTDADQSTADQAVNAKWTASSASTQPSTVGSGAIPCHDGRHLVGTGEKVTAASRSATASIACSTCDASVPPGQLVWAAGRNSSRVTCPSA